MLTGVGFTSIDQFITDWFNSLWIVETGNGSTFSLGNLLLIVLCLLMTLICSGLIGYEREYHGHSAGLRTHMLVAISSCLIMIISVYGFSAAYPNRDPARLAAQVVSGIGFLGAGTIIQTGTDVKGLTTATTLWLSMAIGLACGSANFVIAILGTTIALIALIMMKHLERFANRKNPILMIVVKSDTPVMKQVLELSARYGISVRDVDSQLTNNGANLRVTMRCTASNNASMNVFVEEIRTTISPLQLKVQSFS